METKRANELWPFPKRAAIFDFDGTLARTSFIWAKVNEEFIVRHGKPYDPQISRELADLTFDQATVHILTSCDIDMSVDDANREINEIASELYVEQIVPRSGALIFLKALRLADVPLAMASVNGPDVLGPFFEHIGMDGLFDVEITSADVPVSKARPDIFLAAAGAMGMEPEDCMVFEDLLTAIRTAKDAGFATCAIEGDRPEEEAEKFELADHYIKSWKDIKLP